MADDELAKEPCFDHSAIKQALQPLADELLEAVGFLELGVELGAQAGELLVDRFAVVLDVRRTDVSAGSEDEVVRGDLVEGRGLAEARDVLVVGRRRLSRATRGRCPAIRATSASSSTRTVRVSIRPSLRASMNSTSPRRSRCRWFARFLATNQRLTGMPVLKNSFSGIATMQSTRSASTSLRRISPSPLVLVERLPLASTKPAMPFGARW